MRALGTFAILVVLAASLTAQSAKVKDWSPATSVANHSKEAQMWMENANVLTQEIIEDGTANLPPYNDFVMNARLAEAWWKVDQRRARKYLGASVAIARDHEAETPIEGFKRLFVAVTVMQIITPLDRNRSEVMLDAILTQATRLGPQAKSEDEQRARAYFADLIVETVSSYEATTIEQRAKLFRAMIKLGVVDNVVPILIEVYRKSPAVGDQLYSEALDEFSNGNASVRLLEALATVPLAESELSISSTVKDKMLKLAADAIESATANGVSEETCKPVMGLAMRVLYFPTGTEDKVRGIVEQCKAAYSDKADQMRIDAALDQKHDFGSAEDALRLAENESDLARKAAYKLTAAGMLADKDPDRAMSILDGLSPEEKEKMPWLEDARENIEAGAIDKFSKTHDYGGLQRLINHSPSPSRTALAIAKATQKGDPAYAASLLPIIVSRLGEGRLNVSEFYIEVVNYVAKSSRPTTPVVFREAMRGINAGVKEFIRGQTPPPAKGDFKRTSFWWQLEPPKLPSLLDVMDQRSTRLTIDTLKFPMARASMRLWLLKIELAAYEAAFQSEKKRPNKTPTDSTVTH